MPASDATAIFLLASLAINFYPGPNNIFALSNSARFGLRDALVASLGRQAAFALLVALLAAGLGAALVAHTEVLAFLKIAGAAFLVWLALRMLAQPADPVELAQTAATPRWQLVQQEFAVAFANPKPILVLVPFLPQLVAPGEVVSGSVAAFGAAFLALEATATLAYALVGRHAQAVATTAAGRLWLNRAGGLSVLLAAWMLVRPV